ncbi:mitoferrin-2 isoform X4 [Chiloscyllium plagiosum]|uniref:mitoferrin-2 isoform X4 n=1 Tax=Chiloscyllium plagiosum TaxID=36176 RepID=UPI001CB8302F|nr:mitoferrin-2 isoform X4 [Chiloscyllium plagiosum]
MQSLQPDPAARYRNVMDALKRIVRTEGFWRPMRGLNVTATGAGPAHALYFACYEKIKKTLSDTIHPGGNSHIANGAAGCVATLFHDAAMNPAEVHRYLVDEIELLTSHKPMDDLQFRSKSSWILVFEDLDARVK